MRDTLTHTALRPGQEVGVCAFRGGFTEATVLEVAGQRNHLGGTWAVLSLRLPDGEVVTGVDTRSHVFVGPERTEYAWCPECRARVEVVEVSTEGHMERRGEVAYNVTHLECGHSTQGEPVVVAAAPGAPYAGPGVAVAASTRPRDLRAARDRQRQIDADPWAQ